MENNFSSAKNPAQRGFAEVPFNKISSLSRDERDDVFGAQKEVFFNVSAYSSEIVTQSPRIAALLFSLAPSSALLDYAAIGAKKDIRDTVEEIQNLRFEASKIHQKNDKQWQAIQGLMKKLMQIDDFTVDAYLARIVAWGRKVFPHLSCDEAITKHLEEKNNEILSYLLNSNNPKDLVGFNELDKVPFEIKNYNKVPERRDDSGKKRNKASEVNNFPQLPKVAVDESSEEDEDNTTNTPNRLSWIVAGVLLLGILLLLLKTFKGKSTS